MKFTVEEDFLADGDHAFLRTIGIEPLAIVHLNGTEVGVIRGSRLQQEVDIFQKKVQLVFEHVLTAYGDDGETAYDSRRSDLQHPRDFTVDYTGPSTSTRSPTTS